MKYLFCLLALLASATSEAATCTVVTADVGRATVQAAINAASDGDVICLPAGSATWTTAVTLAKAIQIWGSGSGGYVGSSETSLAVGTGSKVFTTQASLPFVIGEPMTARYINQNGAHAMIGTVASYSGTTLTLTVTSVTGSGTFTSWVFERPATTTIYNSAVDSTGEPMLAITESTVGSITVQGIHFDVGAGTLGDHIGVTGVTNGYPVLIHDNWFSQTGTMNTGVNLTVNRGVIYRNSFNGNLCSHFVITNCADGYQINGGFGDKDVLNTASWSTASTMGTADTDGTHNLYVENNYFLAFWQAMSGFDSHGRVVFRYNRMNSAALGSHGADTEDLGVRHWEVYNNTFLQTDRSGDPYNINYWFLVRGGTGVITDNVFDDINTPGYWGDKPELDFEIQNLGRDAGPNPCWGANIGGVQYPSPRQVGMGYVTGAAGNDSSGIYKGDSEPVYIWNNTGTYEVSLVDYPPGDCTNPDSIVDYFVIDRDYFVDDGAKPGYTKYTYPHPLVVPAPPSAPFNVQKP